MPALRALVRDSCHYTRAALGSVVMAVADVLTSNQVNEHLLPLFLHLLKDKHPEVRLNVIARLESLSETAGLDLLSQSLLPAIVELATDAKWRVRLAICEHLPSLAKQLGSDFYDEKLDELASKWLSDEVFAIRKAAAINLTRLAEVFGPVWAEAKIVRKVGTLCSNSSCLFRMTALQSLLGLAEQLSPERAAICLLPLIIQLTADVVPNIRFNAVKILGKVGLLVSDPMKRLVVAPRLQVCSQDIDGDVTFHARVASTELKERGFDATLEPAGDEALAIPGLIQLINLEVRQQPSILPRATMRDRMLDT